MKAKEWYEKFEKCSTDEEFGHILTNCLKSLSDDADHLIKIRHAKSDHAVVSCINEVNNKWIAIINLYENKKESYDESHPLYNAKLLKDGFKAAYVHIHPKMGWYFDLTAHKHYVETIQLDLHLKNIANATLKLCGLTAYEDITLEKAKHDTLSTLYWIGHFGESNIAIARCLCVHLTILRMWIKNNYIDFSDVDKAYDDPSKFMLDNGY